MRRPAFLFSMVFTVGVYMAFLIQPEWTDWMALSLILTASALFMGRKKGFFLGASVVLIAGGAAFLGMAHQMDDIGKLTGKEVDCRGIVGYVSRTDDCAKLTIKTKEYGTILVSVYERNQDYEAMTGKTAWFSGLLETPATAGNPGGFDYRLYLRSVGVASVMGIQPDQIAFSKKPVNRFSNWIAVFRQDFSRRLEEEIGGPRTDLIMAMLLGDRSGLSDETYETFQRNGTAHILSVSGLHVGFVYSIFAFLIGGRRKPAANVAILAILVFYGVLSGFCPSVNRALLMIGLHLLSKVLCRQYDMLSAAGVAAAAMLFQNPYALFHVGFQLSFFAVILMAWIFPLTARILQKGHFLAVLLPIPLLQTAMAPYTAFLFNYVSFGAYAANFGVVFFSGLLVPAGLLAMFTCRMPGPAFDLTSVFMDLCVRCVIWFNDATYGGGKTCIDVVSPDAFLLICFYGMFFFILSEAGRILIVRRRFLPVALAALLIVTSAAFVDFHTEDAFHEADAVFVDVGQGDCLHIRTPSGKNVLIDGGGKETFDVGKKVLKPYLLKNGVKRIDLAVATHLDMDHFDGLRGLAACGMVELMGLYDGNRLLQDEIAKNAGLPVDRLRFFHQGDIIMVDEDVWLEVLFPREKPLQAYQTEIEEGDENPRSLVIRVHLGTHKVLMTGDIDSNIEEALLSDVETGGIRSDILKIAHHGSRFSTSDDFLLAANPSVAVVQVGKNNYGHPAPAILEKCREKGIMVWRTDINGAIGFFGLYGDGEPVIRTIREGP